MTNITDSITDGTLVQDMVQDTMARDTVQGFMEETGTAGNVRYHLSCLLNFIHFFLPVVLLGNLSQT